MPRSICVTIGLLTAALAATYPTPPAHGALIPAASASAAPTRHAEPREAIGFRSHELLVEHYRKHGREFGSISMAEYLRRAQELRDHPLGGPILEIVRADGVHTRYDRSNHSFLAFEQSGIILTFFRPRQGETYFRRQALRPARSR